MVKVTALQQRVLDFIVHTISETGMSPTLREITNHFQWKAIGSAQDVIAALRKKGLLEPVLSGKARQTIPTPSAVSWLNSQKINRKAQGFFSEGVIYQDYLPGFPEPKTPLAVEDIGRESRLQHESKPKQQSASSILQSSESAIRDNPFSPQDTLKSGFIQSADGKKTVHIAPKGRRMSVTRSQADASKHSLSAQVLRVPSLGQVQAGVPHEAIENQNESVIFPPHLVEKNSSKHSKCFSLEVQGYSMLDAGLLPGDRLLVVQSTTAKNSEIVVAAVGDAHEVTVKRFALKGSQLYRDGLQGLPAVFREVEPRELPPALLLPENAEFQPIPFGTCSTDRILGVVKSLLRESV